MSAISGSPFSESAKERVIKFVQELLLDEQDRSGITPGLIEQKIDLVVQMKPEWGGGLDRALVVDELVRRFSLWIGQDTKLQNQSGHEAWLTGERKRDWRYWQRYREWLERKLSWKAVDALDRSTDLVLGLLEDPLRSGSWDRRGLVVGHVQSGKTGHYAGLICKAADAGYKIIVVLAGMHNNLRSQTQIRLDEAFLGYETSPLPDDLEVTGVGELDADPTIRPNYATNRSDKGDFSTSIARNLGITPEQRPWLFVVKKNKTVLERLHRWIRNHVANTHDPASGRKVVTDLPLLLIDDESDHASVDTGEQIFDAEGRPDEEHQPTAINRRIRRILYSFAKSAYVGYTATPFANIFIHERGATSEEGPDIFPGSFIINLGAPSNYVGPAGLFGVPTTQGRTTGLPLVRFVDDFSDANGHSGWMPQRHKPVHIPRYGGSDSLPPSLTQAIDSFLLVCGARRLRGQGNRHCSMLIHVTRYNAVQQEVHRQVSEYVRHLRQRLSRGIDADDVIAGLRKLWTNDFVPTTNAMLGGTSNAAAWDDVLTSVNDVVNDVEVRMINGTAKDALDYVEHQGRGLKVIAIGGDKLARGLTLEDLCVSYFLRASRMYDTLMQMGRWFGYRENYLDLTRLYTTRDLVEWFCHITDAAEELREEFDLMAATGATPREYGLKIQSHPVLMVTSPLKMRSARNLMLSFSGQVVETVALYKEAGELNVNLKAVQRLVVALGTADEVDPVRARVSGRDRWSGFLWNRVPDSVIADFLADYRTHPAARKVNSVMLAEFIRSMSAIGELTDWTVMLMNVGSGAKVPLTVDIGVSMSRRQADKNVTEHYAIGRLLDPKDEGIDLDENSWQAALAITRLARASDPARANQQSEPDTPNGPAIRRVRGFGASGIPPRPECGVLLLYLLDPAKADFAFPDDDTPAVVAFGISFPGSAAGLKVEYKVNNVLWEQEYGAAE